ncbi:MAG: hypothetical protein OSJ43_12625 [Oscillospiraceae bacterium]|nr:hypothetical protein [Oscillospiraceae bacterium]
MKRTLLQNVKVQPYTSGTAIDREGFLSVIVAATIGTAGALTLTITHSDDGTDYTAVTDKQVFPEAPTKNGEFTTDTLAKDAVINIDADLLGLKRYVKITASGTAATGTTLAIALGDSNAQPV